jgi:uncharacterized protein YacL
MSAGGLAVRALAVVLAALIGAAAAATIGGPRVFGAIVGVALAALGAIAEMLGTRARIDRLVWGTVGGVIGLVAGAAIGVAMGGLAPALGPQALAIGTLLGMWLGIALGVRRGPDVVGINAVLFPRAAPGRAIKLVDTSAIVDGRIADLAATGFIEGPLVVPQFVLRELQQIADSTDPRKRTRGKRGFEVVQRLQRMPGLMVELDATDVPGVTEVDEKLVELARARGGKVITTDYNLNQRAELSGVTVLNVNDLSNALKPAMVAGEAMRVQVLREGKEAGQGVAYLDDGTMVVVDQGKRWIGQNVDVAVTSVLQTSAGRIIFTRLRDEEPARA